MPKPRAGENYLVIPDLQIPFEDPEALTFARYAKKLYRIPDENCYCVGDEVDQYYGGLYKQSANASHSAVSELRECKEKLTMWYEAFPRMKLAISNHGTRWIRKALDAGIPTELLKEYEDILGAPPGWEWAKSWVVEASKEPFLIEHGDDWGGKFPHVQASLHNGISTVIGHHHSISGVEFLKTNGMDLWSACVGSLIDFESYAFEYAKRYKFKPVSSILIIVDGGRQPILVRK